MAAEMAAKAAEVQVSISPPPCTASTHTCARFCVPPPHLRTCALPPFLISPPVLACISAPRVPSPLQDAKEKAAKLVRKVREETAAEVDAAREEKARREAAVAATQAEAAELGVRLQTVSAEVEAAHEEKAALEAEVLAVRAEAAQAVARLQASSKRSCWRAPLPV